MNNSRLILALTVLLCAPTLNAQVGTNSGLLNPNLATVGELTAIPSLDAATASAIVAARPIASATQLASVLGAQGGAQRAAIFGRMFLPINLNTASREEIMLIPSMSERMAHEFEEYRPYTSLEQFRREMGKYVDAEEVARLEQYVFVPMSLNTASRDAFLTIPGMTERMAHEFDEYRPYTSLDQFRREIGKYVDANEVARLERYIKLDD